MPPMILQRLERRDVPAGTVTVTLRYTTWTIVGDDDENSIKINLGANAGARVTG